MTTTAETINLPGRALVHITGEEAEKFLQAVITTDLDKLGGDEAKPGALLTPQGKILFDFLVSRIENGLRFDLQADIAADFMKRIALYRLRGCLRGTQYAQAFAAASRAGTSAQPSARRPLARRVSANSLAVSPMARRTKKNATSI